MANHPQIKLMTPRFRVSFPQMFEAKQINGQGKAKYGLTMLFTLAEIEKDPIQKKQWQAMIDACTVVAQANWPKGLPANMQNPFRKGEEKEQYQGYGKGVVFITAQTMTRPGLVDEKVVKIIKPEDFYAGCYAVATINPYPWTYMGKNGVSFGLQNVQKVADGEPFGGRTNAEDDFSAASSAPGAAGADSTDAATQALFG